MKREDIQESLKLSLQVSLLVLKKVWIEVELTLPLVEILAVDIRQPPNKELHILPHQEQEEFQELVQQELPAMELLVEQVQPEPPVMELLDLLEILV